MDFKYNADDPDHPAELLAGKSEHTLMLFDHLVAEFKKIGPVTIHPHKTMISIANSYRGFAYVTQIGKRFIHIVFPFRERHDDNLCFQRIQTVPGRRVIYHHFRMFEKADINDEVRKFMKRAYDA